MDGPRILVPIDFSGCAQQALRTADALAAERGGTLHLLHVHTPVEAASMDFSYVQPTDRPADVEAGLRAQLAACCANLLTSADRVAQEVVLGNPVDEIIARSRGFDLAVLGTHGRSGMGRFLLGSVTERVVRGAVCSVYVVKDKAALERSARAPRGS